MSARRFYQGKPITFAESLHYCGCPVCRVEIAQRQKDEPPHKPEFITYLREAYPATAHLLQDQPA